MALNLTITVIDDEDYDGLPVQIKQVKVDIDGKQLPITYSFDGTKPDSEIQTEVEADLTSKGYTWS